MKPFSCRLQMFVDRRERGEAEAAADLLETRGVSVLLNELVQVIQDFALTFGKPEARRPPIRALTTRLSGGAELRVAEVAHYMRTESEDQARIGATLDVASTPGDVYRKVVTRRWDTVVALAIVAAVSAAPKCRRNRR